MGRHRWTERLTVEQCFPLTTEAFKRAEVFSLPIHISGKISWTDSQGRNRGTVEYTTQNASNGITIRIRRQYAALDATLRLVEECVVPVTATPCHFGGQRFWFRCQCGRRVGRLYLPPGQQAFRCRHCFNLTYLSAQTHDQRKYRMAQDLVSLRAALRSGKSRRATLAVDALTLRVEWLRKGRLSRISS